MTGKNIVRVISQAEYTDIQVRRKWLLPSIIELPCGHCVECRLKYSRQWADRLMIEAQDYPDDQKWFVTLTYDDLHLPVVDSVDKDGVIRTVPTLVKKHIQGFIKRLRSNYEYDCQKIGIVPNHIKYFLCGEYGSSSARPHYHLIVFGLPLGIDDLVPFKQTAAGFWLWNSKTIEKAWSYKVGKNWIPYGYSVVSNVSWDTCAYVARYILKKKYGEEKQVYDDFSLQPEFVLMSKKPAIGREFFERNKDRIYEFDEFYISTPEGGRSVRPSRYYDNLYDIENPERLEEIKSRRLECMKSSIQNKKLLTSKDYDSMLEAQEDCKIAVVQNSLKRRL